MTKTEKVYLSATQIDNARTCMRKWAWDKIARIPRPRNLSLELGNRVHEILEDLFKNGTPPNLRETWRFEEGSALYYPGEIAASMLPALKDKKIPDNVHTELSFENESVGEEHGIVYMGKIDIHWVAPAGRYLSIIDHKTSSSPDKWAKTYTELEKDTQRILYSRIGCDMYPNVTVSDFTLNYGSTKLKTKENRIVSRAGTRENIEDLYRKHIEPVAAYMAQAKRSGLQPMDLEPNPSACEMFGGCPYKNNCKLTSNERMRGIMSKDVRLSKIEELLEKAKAKKAAAQQGTKEPEARTGGAFNPPEADEVEGEIVDSFLPEEEERQPEQGKKAAAPRESKKAAEIPVKQDKALDTPCTDGVQRMSAGFKAQHDQPSIAIYDDPVAPHRQLAENEMQKYGELANVAVMNYFAGLAVGANPGLADTVAKTIKAGVPTP